MRIAVVDDEKNVRFALETALAKEGFEVLAYKDGLDACGDLDKAGNSRGGPRPLVERDTAAGLVPAADGAAHTAAPSSERAAGLPPADLYILDIMMPGMDGLTFFRRLRGRFPGLPVIFLTSRDEEFDRVLGLELGADDYLCKPFSMRELIARVHVILRRCGAETAVAAPPGSSAAAGVGHGESVLQSSGIVLDPSSFSAELEGRPLELTVTEFRILETFLRGKGRVLTIEQLVQAAYPEDTYLNDRAIDCHIKRLRKKIGAELIETVYGLGYRFVEGKDQ